MAKPFTPDTRAATREALALADARLTAAARAHALLADSNRWNSYVRLARNLGFRGDAEAVVFCAAAAPTPTRGRKADDPIRAAIHAAAESEGRGPHARKHGAAVVTPPPNDPTNGSVYDVAGGLDHHRAQLKAPRATAPAPAVGCRAAARTLRRHQQAQRRAREARQGFFCGLGFRVPRDPDDDDLAAGCA